ncbi:unnamed protein product, partial [marine sediment metagenome]
IASGVLTEEQGLLTEQRDEARALRDMPMPEGRTGGRMYKAANPLEFMGKLANQYVGQEQGEEFRQATLDAAKEQARLRSELLRAMGPGGAAGPDTMGPAGMRGSYAPQVYSRGGAGARTTPAPMPAPPQAAPLPPPQVAQRP